MTQNTLKLEIQFFFILSKSINTFAKDLFLIRCLSYPAPDPRPSYLTLDPGFHKIFNQLKLLLFKVQSLWSCAHYFQWFTGCLNHVDLFMSHEATCSKKITLLFNVLLTCFVDFILCPTDKYMFKVTNKK